MIEQIGTVVQYLTTTGAVRPGFLLAVNNPTVPTWNLVIFNASGAAVLVTNVANDDTQSQRNTFKILSGSVPF